MCRNWHSCTTMFAMFTCCSVLTVLLYFKLSFTSDHTIVKKNNLPFYPCKSGWPPKLFSIRLRGDRIQVTSTRKCYSSWALTAINPKKDTYTPTLLFWVHWSWKWRLLVITDPLQMHIQVTRCMNLKPKHSLNGMQLRWRTHSNRTHSWMFVFQCHALGSIKLGAIRLGCLIRSCTTSCHALHHKFAAIRRSDLMLLLLALSLCHSWSL